MSKASTAGSGNGFGNSAAGGASNGKGVKVSILTGSPKEGYLPEEVEGRSARLVNSKQADIKLAENGRKK